MDSSDEKSCEGVTHVCDPNVKFGCKDSGEKRARGASDVGGRRGYEEAILKTWPWHSVVGRAGPESA